MPRKQQFDKKKIVAKNFVLEKKFVRKNNLSEKNLLTKKYFFEEKSLSRNKTRKKNYWGRFLKKYSLIKKKLNFLFTRTEKKFEKKLAADFVLGFVSNNSMIIFYNKTLISHSNSDILLTTSYKM